MGADIILKRLVRFIAHSPVSKGKSNSLRLLFGHPSVLINCLTHVGVAVGWNVILFISSIIVDTNLFGLHLQLLLILTRLKSYFSLNAPRITVSMNTIAFSKRYVRNMPSTTEFEYYVWTFLLAVALYWLVLF